MNVWLFSAKPKVFLLSEKIPELQRSGNAEYFGIRQHRRDLKVLDIAILWQSGERAAGIYAIGRLVRRPYKLIPPAQETSGYKWAVDIGCLYLLDSPIFKTDLLDNIALKGLSVLKIPNGKNPRRISEDDWANLQRLLKFPAGRNELVAILNAAAKPISRDDGLGGGESHEHKVLKDYISNNPAIVGLDFKGPGKIEHRLPSADCLDVSFDDHKIWVAVEVKTLKSDDLDIIRGLFQCIKYRAIMEADLAVKQQTQEVRVVLVLQGALSDEPKRINDALRVDVIENVIPHDGWTNPSNRGSNGVRMSRTVYRFVFPAAHHLP